MVSVNDEDGADAGDTEPPVSVYLLLWLYGDTNVMAVATNVRGSTGSLNENTTWLAFKLNTVVFVTRVGATVSGPQLSTLYAAAL